MMLHLYLKFEFDKTFFIFLFFFVSTITDASLYNIVNLSVFETDYDVNEQSVCFSPLWSFNPIANERIAQNHTIFSMNSYKLATNSPICKIV